jgi:hypothetical protein
MSNTNDVAPEISRRFAPAGTVVTHYDVEWLDSDVAWKTSRAWRNDTAKEAIAMMIRIVGLRRCRQAAPSLKYRVVRVVTTTETVAVTSQDQSAEPRSLGEHLASAKEDEK